MPSNRSPSPLSSRPNPTHSRIMESESSLRRSFSSNPNPSRRPSILTSSRSFNPITPSNSPAGFGGRISVEKEGMSQLLSCCVEKENDRDHILKSVKVRSPANGSKNFMSPTISAASKFTPSPRKKPLVERNEQVRTSISLSDGKATFFSAISSENTEDLVLKSEQEKDALDSSTVVDQLEQNDVVVQCPPASSKATKKVTFAELPSDSDKPYSSPSTPSDIDTVTIDSDCFDVETNPQNMSSPFSVIAPLDADPSVPPYDPKLNYLSPRPQFLRYKPNPRFEFLLQNRENEFDSEVKQLEDESFVLESSSGNCSDTDGVDDSNCFVPYKDSEVSSDETEESEAMKEDEEESPSDSEISHETTEKTAARKRGFFNTMKFAFPLLFFLIGVTLVSVPLMNPSITKSYSFSELHLPWEVPDMVKSNFHAYSRKFKELSLDSINHLSFLVKNLGGHGTSMTPQFINLTDIENENEVWQMHTSAFDEKFYHEVCENAFEGRVAVKINENFEKQDMEVQEEGESLSYEEDNISETKLDGEIDLSTQEFTYLEPETYDEVVSDDDTRETETDGELDLRNQEFSYSTALVQQMEEPETFIEVVSDDTCETATDMEIDVEENQEFTLTASVPVHQIEEPEIEAEVVSDDSSETGLDGEIRLGNQEWTSPPSEHQMKEPEILETVFLQEEEGGVSSDDDAEIKSHIDIVEEKSLEEVIDEEKVSEIQSELLVNTNLEASTDIDDSGPKTDPITLLEMVKSPISASIVLLSLVSAAAYVYLTTRASSSTATTTTKNPEFKVQSDQFLKKIIPETTSALEQQQKQYRRPQAPPASSQNWSREFVDVMMEEEEEEEEEASCSSEMSSFRTHSKLMMKNAKDDQTQSCQESKKLRKQSKRDSLASSSEYSTGSPSYGSFTTYEKILNKNATTNGDDEIMTPVRRSSRIRNLATSP